ncbi:8341_t:CDS:2, partial [Funneliformis geosporum]
MTGKFETKEEILKWKYHGKIGAKSENDFVKKYPVKAPEKAFLNCQVAYRLTSDKADMLYDKMWKIYSEAKKSTSSST